MNRIDPSAEQAVREACDAGEFGLATTRSFEAYGAEILSFLTARLRSRSDAEEAFSMFAEDLCQALPAFEFRCTVRGYLYTLARNAANRYASEPHQRRERHVSMSDMSAASAVIERARTDTQLHKRSEVKDKIRSLRERLPEDDQTLLILYVDRALPWAEIAMVMHGGDLAGEALTREAARLRKRFERVKAELRELAIEAGLLQR
jgi:RNA polymerase sigma-70 factor (ECF subfamily)